MAIEPKPLMNKVVLITGAAKRLGRAAALSLTAAGATVAITYLHSKDEAVDTVTEIERLGGEAPE